MKRLTWLCGLAFVVACGSGSGSGVSGSKRLASLSVDEQSDLCVYLSDLIGESRTVQCDDGDDVEIESNEDCTFDDVPASCAATVSDAERCARALGSDPCNLDFEDCAALFQCAFDQS